MKLLLNFCLVTFFSFLSILPAHAQCDQLVQNGSFETGNLSNWDIISTNVDGGVLPAGSTPRCGMGTGPMRPTRPIHGTVSYFVCFNGSGNAHHKLCQTITLNDELNLADRVIQLSWYERMTWDLSSTMLSTGKSHTVTIRDASDNILQTCHSRGILGELGASGDTGTDLFECEILAPGERMLEFKICFEDNLPQTFIGSCTIELDDIQANIVCESIPTLTEWGTLIFGLSILNLGLIFLYRKEAIHA